MEEKTNFEDWVKDLEDGEQPTTCNIENPENCESCSG